MNGFVPSCGDHAFASYIGHHFFWAEVKGTPEPLSSPGAKGHEIQITVNADSLLYSIRDDSSPAECIEKHENEVKFLNEYRERTGRHWLHVIGRPPPTFPMWESKPHTVRTDALSSKWFCEDSQNVSCRGAPEDLQLEVVTDSPRAFVVHNFLSDWECDYVIQYHTPRMFASTTGQGENEELATQRTSTSDRMNRKQYPLADVIYRRLALILGLPEWIIDQSHNAESINVVHYLLRQEYLPHYDPGPDTLVCRWISALLYFNTPTKGGNTSFPLAKVELEPRKGSVMFFYDLLPDGNLDEYSLHGGEPVLEGEKWIGAAWIWDPWYAQYDTTAAAEEARQLHLQRELRQDL
jgi:prolyl 4-hydroxylase